MAVQNVNLTWRFRTKFRGTFKETFKKRIFVQTTLLKDRFPLGGALAKRERESVLTASTKPEIECEQSHKAPPIVLRRIRSLFRVLSV